MTHPPSSQTNPPNDPPNRRPQPGIDAERDDPLRKPGNLQTGPERQQHQAPGPGEHQQGDERPERPPHPQRG